MNQEELKRKIEDFLHDRLSESEGKAMMELLNQSTEARILYQDIRQKILDQSSDQNNKPVA